MKKYILFGFLLFIGIVCVNAQNTQKNYRVHYEEIMEASLSRMGPYEKDTRGQVIHKSTIIISIQGYPSLDKIYEIVGKQLDYVAPGGQIELYGPSTTFGVLSDVKWLRLAGYGGGSWLYPHYYELRITNYEEL